MSLNELKVGQNMLDKWLDSSYNKNIQTKNKGRNSRPVYLNNFQSTIYIKISIKGTGFLVQNWN